MRISTEDRIKQSAKDLLRKQLLPERSLSVLTDLNNLKAAIYSVKHEFVHEWKCPDCGIVVFGPKKWMIEHSKYHAEKKEIKENEIRSRNYKVY